MNTEQIMRLADDYAQACVELECENDEHGTVSGSSVDAMTDARAALEAALTEKQEPCGCPPEGFCGKGSRCKDSALVAEQEPELEDLLGQYWDLAYAEGYSRGAESYGNAANEVLHKIRKLTHPAPVNQQLLSALKLISTVVPSVGHLEYCRGIARAAIQAAEKEKT